MDLRRRLVRGPLALLALLFAACAADVPSSSSAPGSPQASTPASRPVGTGYTGDLPPLPQVQFAAARPAPILRAAYEFAGRHPEVLRYLPCFCGCERNGHGNNEDCFVAGRDAGGRPKWSPHGVGCGICIDVAHHAMSMHRDGATVVDIRKAIDQKYRSEHATSTPTPHPH
jgi:hypothetical protein